MIDPADKDVGRTVTLRVYDGSVGRTVTAEIICFDSMGVDVLIAGAVIPKRKNRAELQWTE